MDDLYSEIIYEKDEIEVFCGYFLTGNNFDLNTLTNLSGVEPTYSYKKGEQTKGGVRYQEDCWGVSSRGQITSNKLSDHLEYVLSRAFIVQEKVMDYIESESITVTFEVIFEGDVSGTGPIIPNFWLLKIAQLKHVDLCFEIYNYG